jgi:hypothetical protein
MEYKSYLGHKNNVSESTIRGQVRYKLSYFCSPINLQVSLNFLYEFKLLASFLSSFAKIECTYQDKMHCFTKEPLRASYGKRK